MAQGQLPIGWHTFEVTSRKKAFKTVHELSHLNKTTNNEVKNIANRCSHCGTTLHWHLKTIQCPLYDKKDGEAILNKSKLLKLRWHRIVSIIDECKLHGILQRKSDQEIKLPTKNLKHNKEEQRKQRQSSKSKNDSETTVLDEVYEDADSHWKSQNAESPTKIVESTIAETTSEVKIEETNEHIATAAAGYSFLEDGIPTNNRW
jgi:hypothetical protein